MLLFSSQGYIVQLPTTAALLGLYLTDIYGPMGCFTFQDRMAMITSFSTDESAAIQLRMMFENKSYINVFGDNFGMMSLSGMFASATCQEETNRYSGFEGVSTYFREHRASHLAPALTVLLGGVFNPMYYQAFLINCKISTADPQLQVGNFSLQLAYPIPDEQDNPLNGNFYYGDYDPEYGYLEDESGRQSPGDGLM